MTSKKTTKTTKILLKASSSPVPPKKPTKKQIAAVKAAVKAGKNKGRRLRRVSRSVDWRTAKDQLFWDLVAFFDMSASLHKDLQLFRKAKRTDFIDFHEGKISKEKIYRELPAIKRRQESPKGLRNRAKAWRKLADTLESRAAKLEAKKP